MPGKASYLLALLAAPLIFLEIFPGDAGCQAATSNAPGAANSNAPGAAAGAYIHKSPRRRAAARAKARRLSKKSVSKAGPEAAPLDPGLAYRGLTHETVLAALKTGDFAVLDRGADIRFAGDTLKIAVWKQPSAGERQMRVETIMLAQAIDEHFHGVFEELECCFYLEGAAGQLERATIKLSSISAYRREQLDDQELLAAVRLEEAQADSIAQLYKGLSYRQILDQSAVQDGAFSAERKELSDQLTTLAANGYDVNQATRQFLALEDLIRTRQYAAAATACSQTRRCLAESVARAQGVSVASSRMQNWQR